MSLNAHTSGGTGAGWRNPFQGNAMPWQCECIVYIDAPCNTASAGPPQEPAKAALRKTNPGYLNRCPDCGERRPTPQAHSVK